MQSVEESDLAQLLQSLWKGRMVVAIVTCLFAAGGIAYGLLTKNWYRAEVVLIQASNANAPSGSLAQLAGAASIFGVNIGSGGATQEAIVVLKSRGFVRDFIVDHQLLEVFKDKVDPVAGSWKMNTSVGPDVRAVVEYFRKKVFSVNEDKKAEVVSLVVTWTNGEVAALWANELVEMVNSKMRDRAVTEAQRNIDYLKREMATTNVTSLQQAIGRLLETEMQKLMLARGNEEYAFKIVDRATPPTKKYWPPRVILVIASAIIGFVVSIAGLFILAELRVVRSVVSSDVANR